MRDYLWRFQWRLSILHQRRIEFPRLINLHDLSWRKDIVLPTSKMNTSCELEHKRNGNIHSHADAGKLLDKTNQWRISSGSGTTPQLTTTSGLIVRQQIRTRSVLLKIWTIIHTARRNFKRFAKRGINLSSKI